MKNMLISFLAVILVIAIQFSSCKKDSLEDLQVVATDSTVCDTSFIVSYQNDIVPILRFSKNNGIRACYNCHDPQSPEFFRGLGIRLEGYEFLKIYVDNDQLLCAIKQTRCAGTQPMPYLEGKLSDCDIERVEAWINQGAFNN